MEGEDAPVQQAAPTPADKADIMPPPPPPTFKGKSCTSMPPPALPGKALSKDLGSAVKAPPEPREIAGEIRSAGAVDSATNGAALTPTPAAYEKPEWSGAPSREDFPYALEVLKTGTIVDTVDLGGRELLMIGRLSDTCDYTLEHPSISRQHAAIQFAADGAAYIYDMSTHGTRVNKRQLKSRVYAKLSVGDVIQLGQSSRLLIFQGPEELMQAREGGWGYKQRPEEASSPSVDEIAAAKAKALALKMQRDKDKREGRDGEADGPHALLQRQSEGASWGFGDDASDDDEEETSDAVSEARRLRDEGKLTEKQEQLLDKLEKRLTKINNLKEEIRRIKVKREAGAGGKEKEQKMREMEDMIGMQDDGGGGVLTAGQLRAIERNEAQIKKHEADMLPQEEALAELLRTMLGDKAPKSLQRAPVGGGIGKKKGVDDECDSEDDEFYDRTASRAKAVARKAPPQTLKTLKEKMAQLEAELATLKDEAAASLQNAAGAQDQEAGVDSMDTYMLEMREKERLARDRQRRKRINEIQEEMSKTDRMIKIATPALALDAATPLPLKKPGAALSAFTFKQFAGASRKASSSAVTAEAAAAAKALAGRVFATPTPAASQGSSSSSGDGEAAAGGAEAKQGKGNGSLHASRSEPDSPAARKPAAAASDEGEVAGNGAERSQEAGREDEAQALVARGPVAAGREAGVRDGEGAPGPAGDTVGQKRVREGSADRLDRQGREGQGAPGGGRQEQDGDKKRAPGVPAFADFQQGGLYRAPKKKSKLEVVQHGAHTGESCHEPAGAEMAAVAWQQSEEDVTWVPPSGQTGDGKTSLNAKLGY